MKLVDASERAQIAEDLDHSFIVEASAGTGKTTALIGRIVAAIQRGRATLDSLIAVTFTEKAAGEMKIRLRAAIESALTEERNNTEQSQRLLQALNDLETAHIGTIHAFCSDILRRYPNEANIDSLFEVLPQERALSIFSEVFDDWYRQQSDNPPQGIRRVAVRESNHYQAESPRDVLVRSAWSLVEYRDYQQVWDTVHFERSSCLDEILRSLQALARIAREIGVRDDFLVQNLQDIRIFCDEVALRERIRPRDYDQIESGIRRLISKRSWLWRGFGSLPNQIKRNDLIEQRNEVHAQINEALRLCDMQTAALLQQELKPLLDLYQRRKQEIGGLDFLDLLLLTKKLIYDNPTVQQQLHHSFRCVYVDELQDTDPLQAEILLAIAAPSVPPQGYPIPEHGRFFGVGDPKQSIYRFRRADVGFYESIKATLLEHGCQFLRLSTNFRSSSEIVHAVNASFTKAMRKENNPYQADYSQILPHRSAAEDYPSLIALPVPEPYSDWGKITKWSIEQSAPTAIAAFIDYLIRDSGWTIVDKASNQRVPLEARHVCLLFKRFQRFGQDTTRPYVRALEARRVPHVLVGGRAFHEREEVAAIRNAVLAIERPDDELSVFAALRGPIFGLRDDVILAFRDLSGSLNPLKRRELGHVPELLEVQQACELLANLHRQRNRRKLTDTIQQLLELTRAHAGFAIWPTGEQALANVLRILELARSFESRGCGSFRQFADKLLRDVRYGQATEAPIVEEGTDGIRLMTVHRAKGLEFPVVILCEPTASTIPSNPSRYIDTAQRLCAMPLAGCVPKPLVDNFEAAMQQEEAEAIRLTYVAATRARDLLVVPSVGDDPQDGWLSSLHPSVYPATGKRRQSEPPLGCPNFGEDTVLARPSKAEEKKYSSVRPGKHIPQAGAHHVTWWDPANLDLHTNQDVGIRQQKLLEVPDHETEQTFSEYERWHQLNMRISEHGCKPRFVVSTVTERSKQAIASGQPPEIIVLESNRSRVSRGTDFGAFVHEILAKHVLAQPPDTVSVLASSLAHRKALNQELIEDAVQAANMFLSSPLGQSICEARQDQCFRELPLQWNEGEHIIEGVADIVFFNSKSQRWTVVDYKTESFARSEQDIYARQVLAYARGFSLATKTDLVDTVICYL